MFFLQINGKIISSIVSARLSIVSARLSIVSARLSIVSARLSIVSARLSIVSARLSIYQNPFSHISLKYYFSPRMNSYLIADTFGIACNI
jgi:hypothetical protein